MNIQIPKPATASQFCWLFAAACVRDDTLTNNENVSAGELRLLESYLSLKKYPPSWLIRKIFRRPFQTIVQEGKELNLDTMHWYWTHQHRNSRIEETPVDYRMVSHNVTNNEGRIYSVYDSTAHVFEVHNVHGYRLEKDDFVYTHGDIIAYPLRWG